MSPLEQAIQAAGTYVCPTRDLRPRIMEAAKEECGHQRRLRRLGTASLTLGLLIALALPTVKRWGDRLERSQAPFTNDLHQQATTYSARAGIGPNWALTEAYLRLRKSQASRFPQPVQKNR